MRAQSAGSADVAGEDEQLLRRPAMLRGGRDEIDRGDAAAGGEQPARHRAAKTSARAVTMMTWDSGVMSPCVRRSEDFFG